MIRRILTGPLGLKVVTFALAIAGVAERVIAYGASTLVTCCGVGIVRDGWREQYIEPPHEQAERLMRDYVYGRGFWTNGPETVEDAIARLATPHLLGGKK